ncbi:MAG: serine hydrolase domain-containing protein [Vicinamibacterales bacterium]
MRKIALLAVLVLASAFASPSTEQSSAQIDTLLDAAVEQKRVPMAVAMIADARDVVYEHAAGAKIDAIFAIASMTKPITSVAVMQLVEAGQVKLDEPAATYLPEISAVRVLDGGTLRPPKSPITVRHLLTHTAGFGYEFKNREILELVSKKELSSVMAGGDGFLKAPLLVDPGTRWEYGINTDWLGKLVERVSGRSLEVYFRERIFNPLGMSDSFFNVPPDKRSRLVSVFQRTDAGTLAELPRQPAPPADFYSGGGGLYSTAPDYLRFIRALMAGGQLGQHRILSTESMASMGKNQIGELKIPATPSLIPQLAADGAVLPGSLDKFGLGFALNTKPTDNGRAPNTMSWGGIYNTFFWIDREKHVGAVLMTQMLPFLDPGPQKLIEDFDRAVYARRAR